ncbi:RHS repeat-associated core domain-containing protein [Acidovorax sp. NCPPB 3576]|uniref:RHS repeat-associated core domain-containing protein n=1 Tax=Acidovorax sp. NCPPB 3576 TaxID=2940488 RepID=UPI00234B71C1|nr:RHS repeat-associated core domain-containing protein [Acidovorax sp. NCPPB 3576]WCM87698.1 polymorphic toxin type 37 domain-containing protein [Acidovorax sp. NCPPB 3576]
MRRPPGNPAPLAEQRSYTSAGQLAASALLQLTWDSAGRIAQITQQHMLPTQSSTVAQQVALTSAYSYDAVGRLTASAHSAPNPLTLPSGTALSDTIGANASGYAWDANGNRSQSYYSSSTAAGTATLQRDYQLASNNNRLGGYTQTFTPAGGSAQTTNVSYIHDATGSITKKGDSYLHYGVDGRIAKAGPNADPANALAVSYTYNALGQRVFKSDARLSGANNPAITQQTVYAEDGIGSTVLGQYGSRRSSDSAAPAGEMGSTEVIYLPTASGPMPIAAQINGRLYAIDADHLNTPRRLTNTQGQVAWQWLITGFGEANPTTGATNFAQSGQGSSNYAEAIKFDLRYPGQVFDEETQLNYNLNRSYDPPSGRYFQADPIGLDGGWNRFLYVGGNPASYTDPTGEFAIAIPLIPAIITGTDIVVGTALGTLGYGLDRMFAKPPKNAYDPNGPKAPGKPGDAEGFKDPKGGENWMPNPNPGKGGSGYGWEDAKGDVWCPTGPTGPGSRAHGGPHWDVQTPGGGYRNERPRQ